jgi:hypothetical protein
VFKVFYQYRNVEQKPYLSEFDITYDQAILNICTLRGHSDIDEVIIKSIKKI